ncbi:GNAT family N-acetyltransferase [Paenibacillus typhae]|uniref:GNAT family N-acetyltransferase n=1 Tax=Paenibacillus typhae TaxID=1174501 RepID=UPI001C8DB4DB|nr:GNAT family N-acetyltransferase [Paenibacillus typhae]MBY0008881.1 GNAT family N-acetyltransferase [Paenibacillus typhae]
MNYHYRAYERTDMLKVRQFLSEAYGRFKRPNSWLIARWEFEIFFFQLRAGTLQDWERNIGLWEDETGRLAAVASKDGDFYFQLDSENPPDSLTGEMFDYIEGKSAREPAEYCKLAIPNFMGNLERQALSRGYELLPDESDSAVSIVLDKEFPVLLPGGFRLSSGEEVSDDAKARGHIMAFNYPGTTGAEQMLQFYGGIREAPGYSPELDLALLNEQGEVVSFCNAFIDEANRIGMLEPVGTHLHYRKRGLGKAVIYEALNRLRSKGMIKAYTGPYQPFYGRIGFTKEVELGVWRKKING